MNNEEYENFKNNCYRVKDLSENDILKEYYLWKIEELKEKLLKTDYKAMKYAEGLITEEEYLPIKEERQEYRNKINEYEELIKKLESK